MVGTAQASGRLVGDRARRNHPRNRPLHLLRGAASLGCPAIESLQLPETDVAPAATPATERMKMVSLYRKLVRTPVLGPILRWLAAFILLGRDRSDRREFQREVKVRLANIEAEMQRITASAQKLVELKIEPTVLRTLGESVPVSLRALRRDVESLKSELKESKKR